mgnify:FL=1
MGVLLILFLSMYTWNKNTHVLDDFSTDVGLELTGGVITPIRYVQDKVTAVWKRYVYLVDVNEKNAQLEARVRDLEARLLAHKEDMAELARLRELLQLPIDESWTPVGARVLAGHLGPNSLLDSITINRGYATGARPGTPIVTHKGLIGRVLRASPHTATALLLTNPGSRIAIFTQESRTAGILTGEGTNKNLAVRYMQRDTKAKPGEILITSGLDGKYPKGIPVARVISVAPSNYTEFMTIYAEPLVDMQHIEEVMLLEPTGIVKPPMVDTPDPVFAGPPLPSSLLPKQKDASSSREQPAQGHQRGF